MNSFGDRDYYASRDIVAYDRNQSPLVGLDVKKGPPYDRDESMVASSSLLSFCSLCDTRASENNDRSRNRRRKYRNLIVHGTKLKRSTIVASIYRGQDISSQNLSS